MPDDFVVARNPDGDSDLPYLLRLPLPDRPVVLKARETWPRTTKVYCHRVDDWPDEPEVVLRVPTRVCAKRGASIDLVLDRGRENRSQFVVTQARGRQVIFWQSARTTKQARPRVTTPTARASGLSRLDVVVDARERYALAFPTQDVEVTRAALPAGDYGVRHDGRLLAVVERKSLDDLVSSLTNGRLRYQLADLAAVPRAAVVVEERYSEVFKQSRVRPAVVADALAECQVRWPQVPIVFVDTRKLAAEWTYRFLAAAAAALPLEEGLADVVGELTQAPALPAAPPTPAQVRAWARSEGHTVSDKGRVPKALVDAFAEAHR